MMETAQRTKSNLIEGIEGIVHSRKVARNTVLFRLRDGTECVKYHNTVVVTKNPDGTVFLDSGGFRTQTTKQRIFEHTGIRINPRNGIWYLSEGMGVSVPFYDGISIYGGKVISKIIKDPAPFVKKMKARIKKYCLLITKDKLPFPRTGDCFYCQLHNDKGQSMGDTFGHPDTSHLLSHLKEGYIVGALIIDAMREKGYSDAGISMYYHEGLKGDEFYLKYIRKAVTAYLQHRLIPGINVK